MLEKLNKLSDNYLQLYKAVEEFLYWKSQLETQLINTEVSKMNSELKNSKEIRLVVTRQLNRMPSYIARLKAIRKEVTDYNVKTNLRLTLEKIIKDIQSGKINQLQNAK